MAANREGSIRYVQEVMQKEGLKAAQAYVPLHDPVMAIDLNTPDDLAVARAVVEEGLFDFGPDHVDQKLDHRVRVGA